MGARRDINEAINDRCPYTREKGVPVPFGAFSVFSSPFLYFSPNQTSFSIHSNTIFVYPREGKLQRALVEVGVVRKLYLLSSLVQYTKSTRRKGIFEGFGYRE